MGNGFNRLHQGRAANAGQAVGARQVVTQQQVCTTAYRAGLGGAKGPNRAAVNAIAKLVKAQHIAQRRVFLQRGNHQLAGDQPLLFLAVVVIAQPAGDGLARYLFVRLVVIISGIATVFRFTGAVAFF